MSCMDLALGGILGFVIMTLIGVAAGITGPEPDPSGRLPTASYVCFFIGLLCMTVAFGATVVEIAVRILRS